MRAVRISSSAARAAVAAVCLLVAMPVSAQEVVRGADDVVSLGIVIDAASLRSDLPRLSAPQVPIRQPVFPVRGIEEPRRPAAMLPLYGSLIALQGLDIHSTRRAIGSGAGSEANPAMRPIVKNSAAFVAVKAGATAGVIWASEKLWRKNRKAAVVFAGVVNAAMAAVVANNYRVNR
jgi:hypothetical protein